MRAIDADVLFTAMGDIKPTSQEEHDAIGVFMNMITNSPTIQFHTENKKGRWIVDRYCSECEWDKKDAELVCNIPTNYCPNCGAKMVNVDMRGKE